PPRILNMTVPQTGHLPLMALRPFFMTTSTDSAISFEALHFTQYPSAIIRARQTASCAPAVKVSLRHPPSASMRKRPKACQPNLYQARKQLKHNYLRNKITIHASKQAGKPSLNPTKALP